MPISRKIGEWILMFVPPNRWSTAKGVPLQEARPCNLHTLDSLRRRLRLVALDLYLVFTLARLR